MGTGEKKLLIWMMFKTISSHSVFDEKTQRVALVSPTFAMRKPVTLAYQRLLCRISTVLHLETFWYIRLRSVFCGVVCQTDLVITILNIFFTFVLICPSIVDGKLFKTQSEGFYCLQLFLRLFSVIVYFDLNRKFDSHFLTKIIMGYFVFIPAILGYFLFMLYYVCFLIPLP